MENLYIYQFRDSESNVICDNIKLSEDETGIILRLVEFDGIASQLMMDIAKNVVSVYETDLLENRLERIPMFNHSIVLNFTKFEIKTLLLVINEKKNED